MEPIELKVTPGQQSESSQSEVLYKESDQGSQ